MNNRFTYLIAGVGHTTCMRYDLQEDTWETIPEIKGPGRRLHGCCFVAGKIYMFGGQHGNALLRDVQVLPFHEDLEAQNREEWSVLRND